SVALVLSSLYSVHFSNPAKGPKLEDLTKLVSHVQLSFKDLDSPEDDPIIVVNDTDEDDEVDKDEVHTTTNDETEDTLVPKSSYPSGGALLWRRGVLLLLFINKGWVDGNGSNSGGGFRKPGGVRETRGVEDTLKGPGGQLSMV
nr:hypothetical protein [Tanacetum cinerariifolium]